MGHADRDPDAVRELLQALFEHMVAGVVEIPPNDTSVPGIAMAKPARIIAATTASTRSFFRILIFQNSLLQVTR